jgi:hypothetical protein
VNSTTKPLGQRIAPPLDAPPCISTKPGYMKVRLFFLTSEPKHIRSQMLKSGCGAKPPFIEDVCILMQRMKVFPNLEYYSNPLFRLQLAGVVSSTAKLTGYTILDGDDDTLSYVV